MSLHAQEPTPGPQPRFQIFDVDSTHYPTVTWSVDLLGVKPESTGVSPDFFVSEPDSDGSPVGIVKPEIFYDQPIKLVMVLDCSVKDVNDWSNVRLAAQQVLLDLGDHLKEVAVIAYGSKVQVIQPWTTKRTDALNQILQILPQQSYSAFNSAIGEALKLASQRPGERVAILVFADQPDNLAVKSVATEQLSDILRVRRVPLFILGYGEKAKSKEDEFALLATASQGYKKVVGSSSELNTELLLIYAALQGRSALTHLFQTPVDNDVHLFTLQIDSDSTRSITTTGQYTATRHDFEVELAGLAKGASPQYEPLRLSAIPIGAPAKPLTMTYMVDERPLGTYTYTNHELTWDWATDLAHHALQPGLYTITVEIDYALGNSGQNQGAFYVPQPITATILAYPTQTVIVNEPFSVTVTASSEFTLQEISLLVDDDFTQTLPLPSDASFSLTQPVTISKPLAIGNHSLRLFVRDSIRPAITVPAYPLQFAVKERELSLLEWLKAIIMEYWLTATYVLAALFALILLWTLFAMLFQRRRRARFASYWLQIVNQGNVPARYQFRAETATDAPLDFRFVWGNAFAEDMHGQASVAGNGVGNSEVAGDAIDEKRPSPSEANTGGSQTTRRSDSSAPPALTGAYSTLREQTDKTLGSAGGLADFFNEIAKIPGPLSPPARRIAAML
ncbi:MAG: VWA domain-containing protein, partial [Caldilineaceae bacterium]|nr:VWA domain-containing protein [Caldilineaceae bacterium]